MGSHSLDRRIPLDRRIAAIAADQHAIIDCGQLRDLGLGRGGIAHRVRCGRLHPMHRGVYAVGHPAVGREGRWLAAVRAVGTGAVLSHRSAAALHGLRSSSRASVDVTTPRRSHPRRGIDVHRTGFLPPEDVTEVDRIPCTTLARTLVDLGEVLPPAQIERAVGQAEVNGQFDLRALNDAVERHRKRRGAAVVRRVLEKYDVTMTETRSELERRFIRLCRRFEIPLPSVNAAISLPNGQLAIADALWERRRLIVELDGRETHDTRRAFERDRHRDAQLVLAGYRVVRFTWRQVTQDGAGVVATLRALLER